MSEEDRVAFEKGSEFSGEGGAAYVGGGRVKDAGWGVSEEEEVEADKSLDCLAEGFPRAGRAVEDKVQVLRENAVKKHDGFKFHRWGGYFPGEVTSAPEVFFELGKVMFEEIECTVVES
jgi:hypothetical protein